MEIAIPHSVTYTNETTISVTDIAQSLIANEAILKMAIQNLQFCFKGFTVEKIDVKFREATHGSPLKQTMIAITYATFQKDLENEVPGFIGQIIGTPIDEKYHAMITVLVLITAICYIDALCKRYGRPTVLLRQHYDKLLEEASSAFGLSKSVLQDRVEASCQGAEKKSMIRHAMNFFWPAKQEKGAKIILGNKKGGCSS